MEHSGLASGSSALYEKYGNNEPYTRPDGYSCHKGPKEDAEMFFKLMTGPSTNFYVGPEKVHYTIPKRLIYHFSDYAKACLEGPFSESAANAIWLRDVDPEVFKLLWRWLYSGVLDIHGYCDMDYEWRKMGKHERDKRVCLLLCRVHMLAERLLFHWVFLQEVVQEELNTLLEEAEFSPFMPDILQEVFSNSTPVENLYIGAPGTLRGVVLNYWKSFHLCTTIDYYAYVDCFELDGEFAAEMMAYMAYELQWAVERWEKQTQTTVDVDAKKKQLAEDDGLYQCMDRRDARRDGVWLARRYMCTWTGCTTTPFRDYSDCFELDGKFAADIMGYMAEELLWVVDRWGTERGWSVDFSAEKDQEEYDEALQSMVDKIQQRGGWR